MTDEEKMSELTARYAAAAHAIQSGVMQDHATWRPSPGHSEPDHSNKNVRTGINMAMVDSAGIVQALIDNGILTELQVFEAITVQAEAEKERYEKLLSERLGIKISLA